MIVKKVPTSKLAAMKSKALNVRALADYIAGPKAGGDGEKVEHRGALNLLNIDHEGQVQEMIDLAEAARRSPRPVQHWIMSWREGEQPTPAQADEAVATFVDEMGLEGEDVQIQNAGPGISHQAGYSGLRGPRRASRAALGSEHSF